MRIYIKFQARKEECYHLGHLGQGLRLLIQKSISNNMYVS
jgi:hypothetical protein